MSMPKCLLLDLDGTLANSLHVMQKAYNLFAHEFKLDSVEHSFDEFNGPPIREIIKIIKFRFSLNYSEKYLEDFYMKILINLYTQVEIAEGALEFIRNARVNNCKIGLVTSSYREIVFHWLNKNEIATEIDFLVCSNDVTHGKPNPEPYLQAIILSEYDVNDIIVVEDSYQGVESAVLAGLQVYQLKNVSNLLTHPDAYPVTNFKKLSEILFD